MNTQCIAFKDHSKLAEGSIDQVALQLYRAGESELHGVLVFDANTSAPIELDLRGGEEAIARRIRQRAEQASEGRQAGRGRPRLGVVSREITLLPRHWAWLNEQRGGASAALRRLVDQARRSEEQDDRIRQAQNAAYGFMTAIAGNEPGFEEATRALFRKNRKQFAEQTSAWPADIRDHVMRLAAGAFESETGGAS